MSAIPSAFTAVFQLASNIDPAACAALGETIEAALAPPRVWSLNVTAVGSLPAAPAGYIARIIGADAANARYVADAYAGVPSLATRRSNGTGASPTAILSGDVLSRFEAFGRGATGLSSGGRAIIEARATQNWTDTAQGCLWAFQVTPNGGFAPVDAIRIEQDGAMSFLFGALISGKITKSKHRSVPLTGGTVNLAAATPIEIIDPAGTLAALTVNLPGSPVDGQLQRVSFTQAITTLTMGGGTISNAPTTAAAAATFEFIYDLATTKWYRVMG